MKRIFLLVGILLAVFTGLAIIGSSKVNAQEPLKSGKILQRTDLVNAPGYEAILVMREVPPGKESGKHTQSGNEIAYVASGSVTVEIAGKPPMTVKTGEAFTTSAGQVHNVKNASTTEGATAIVFYIAKKGAKLEDLSSPVK